MFKVVDRPIEDLALEDAGSVCRVLGLALSEPEQKGIPPATPAPPPAEDLEAVPDTPRPRKAGGKKPPKTPM